MKRTSSYLLWLAASSLLLASCDTAVEPERTGVIRELTVQEQQSVQMDNRFGLKLFRGVNEGHAGDNVFISPLSVSLALGMTLNGANGETRAAMEQTLERNGMSAQEINEAYKGLTELLLSLDPRVAIQIANSIWYRQGFTVEQEFLSTNQTYFDAEVREADFASPDAVDLINGWVDEKTHGRIEQIIETIPDETIMYLINAIYFKGTWRYEFDPEHTRTSTFHLQDGGTRDVEMMSLEGGLPYFAGERFQAVDLPYGDSLFSMTIFLPAPGEDVNGLAASLTDEAWGTWTGQFTRQDVKLEVPKFRLEFEDELKKVLTGLGMGVAFTPAADFTRINRNGGLLISRVLHKTFVEVNEEGTEAAAVTAVEIRETSAQPGPVVMRIDRPFLFAIRERHSGTILFIGKMMDPGAA